MSDRIRRLLSLLSDAPPKPMSRREFLQRVGGAAALAAVPGKVAPQATVHAPGLLPKAMEQGFSAPEGVEVFRLGDRLIYDDEYLDYFDPARGKDEVQKAIASLERARAAASLPAPGGVSQFNFLTNSWHQPVRRAVGENLYETAWLPSGQDAIPDGWRRPDLDGEGFWDWSDFDPRAFREVQWDLRLDENTTRELMDRWRRNATAHLEHRRTRNDHPRQMSQDPEYRDQHVQLLRDLELAPGGRPDPQPVMGLDDDPLRRGSGVIPEAWNQRVRQIPFKKPGRGAIYAPAIGAALLAPQEEKK